MNKNLLILGVLLLLVLGSLLFIFKDRIPILNNDYTLPNNLTYSQDPGWSDVSGDGWTLSFKKDWQMKSDSIPQGPALYTNKEKENVDSLIIVEVVPPSLGLKSTFKEQFELFKEAFSEYPQAPIQIIKSQELKINGYKSGIIFLKIKDTNLINIHALIDKNNTVYTLDISMRENFYKSNKADIEYLISSFR